MRLGQHDARHDRLLGCSHFEQRKLAGPRKKKRPGHFGSACWRGLRAAPCGTRRSMETFATASCCCAITPPRNRSEPRIWLVLSEGVMTFMIHASKNGQSVVTVRIVLVRPLLSTRRACWKAWAGKFTLPTQPGTSSTLRTSTGFQRLLTKRPSRLVELRGKARRK